LVVFDWRVVPLAQGDLLDEPATEILPWVGSLAFMATAMRLPMVSGEPARFLQAGWGRNRASRPCCVRRSYPSSFAWSETKNTGEPDRCPSKHMTYYKAWWIVWIHVPASRLPGVQVINEPAKTHKNVNGGWVMGVNYGCET